MDAMHATEQPPTRWGSIEEWRLAQRAQGLSARTVTERCRVAQSLADANGQDPVGLSTRQFRGWLAAQRVSTSTLATYDRYLRAYTRFLVDEDLRADDPLAKARRVKDPRREARPITDAHLEALLVSRKHWRTQVMALLGAFQGLRASEIAAVRGEDVDTVAGLFFVIGKGGTRVTMPLHPLVAQAADRMPRAGYWFPAHEYTGRGDTHIHGNSVSSILSDAMRRAGIPGGTAHRLRHWYGTSLVKGGTNLRAVQQLLRHASLATTERYVRVEEQAKVDGIARLGGDLQLPPVPRRKGAA
jgi:integrase/recombinase XerD